MKSSIVRIITGVCLALILIPLLLLGSWSMLILTMALAYLSCYELLMAFSKKEPGMKSTKVFFPLLASVFVLVGHFEPEYLVPLMIIVVIGISIISLAFSTVKVLESFFLLFIMIYTGIGFFSATEIAYFNPANFPISFPHAGFFLIIYLYGIIALTDIGAYTIGSFYGKRKLCPAISPKKTVEGAIGGTLLGTLLGTGIYFLFEGFVGYYFLTDASLIIRILIILVISLLISVVGQFGDLVASKIKRALGIKDFGKILPGHGGILDRFDSFLLAGMVFYLLVRFIGVI